MIRHSSFTLLLLTLALPLAGCTTRSKAKAEAQAAFTAGQKEALLHPQQPHNPIVTIVGQVRNATIPWTADLSVAKAILAADYVGSAEPAQIMIVRNGQAVPIDLDHLLKGEDWPLLSGDLLIIKQ
jgi:hypothetical protein